MVNFILVLILILFYRETYSQELYTFDWNSPRVNINGQPHFKVNYFPENPNYKGDFYPDLESNTKTVKYTFKSSCTLYSTTDYISSDLFTPPVNTTENPTGTSLLLLKNVLVVPEGVTVTFSGRVTWLYTFIIKGRVVLDPNDNTYYSVSKTILYPTGVFESKPNSNFNHSIFLVGFERYDPPTWDPLQTSPFISLGGTVDIVGFNSEPMWTGRNTSKTSSYGGSFLRPPFSYTSSGLPLFRMNGNYENNNDVGYTMNQYYTGALASAQGSNEIINDPFNGAGYIIMRPWTKNIFIKGLYNSSMTFTLGSKVNIQNTMFFDIGHTNKEVLDDNVLDSNYNVIKYGKNIPDRYPITLLHNKVAVTINNNIFMDYDYNGPVRDSATPRAYIGAKRSFGTISGNGFALRNDISGITLLYGTEQFNISYNGFISLYTNTGTISSYRAYPDIDYINSGIITTSPYSTYEGNAFEGKFKGGAIQVIPVQSRSSILGMSSDKLIGVYSGLTQDNTADYKTNNVWNNVVFLNHFFAGETEVRVRYPIGTQPPLRINLKNGWYIGQKPSLTLFTNQANIEFFYDSPYIANSLSSNEKLYISTPNTHTGKYNAVTIVNALAKGNYAFFSESFTCGYLSIKDSQFSHFSSSASFLKKFTSQLYLSNVNGTKSDIVDGVNGLVPLYNFNPIDTSLTTNQLSISFKPNTDYLQGLSQNVDYIVNDAIQSTDYPSNGNTISKVVNLPRSNGPYSVLVSSNLLYAPNYPSYVGPYYAQTYTADSGAQSFYLGIDLTPDFSTSAKSLSILNNLWTKCGWISDCKVTGKYSKVTPTPSTVTESTTGTIRSATDEVSMLTSFLSNDVTLGIKSSVNLTLPANAEYKFFIYSYNAFYTGANIIDSLPLFTIKINGKYQNPYTRPSSLYQKYQKFGPFYWNSGSTDITLIIEWGSDNLKYSIPMSGIEVFSNLASPYSIPISSSTTSSPVETSSKSTTTTNNNNDSDEHLSAASSSINFKSIFILISFIFTQIIF
ncbi:hypothetical protein ACTA71_010896 [Dictyostelium dimigraforme]